MRKTGSAMRVMLRLAAAAAAVAALGAALLAASIYQREAREDWWQATRAATSDELNLLRADLQGRIDANVQLVRGLVGVIRADPAISPEEFHRIVGALIDGQVEARLVAAAPDMVVRMVHPERGNQGVIGMRLDAFRTPVAQDGIQIVGPVHLPDGGSGIVMRAPVWFGPERQLWGVVSLVLDADAFFRVTGVTAADRAIEVALSAGEDASGQRPVMVGNPAVLGADPVRAEVRVPSGTWQLAAIPAGGWPAAPSTWLVQLLFLATGLVVIGTALGVGRIIASRHRQLALIRQREAELKQLSWRLDFALNASGIGVWDVDLTTDALFWDARAKALFGRSADPRSIYGLADWSAVLHPDDRERAVIEAERTVAHGGRFDTRYRIVRPDGEVRHIRDVAAVNEGPDGSRRLVGLVWDVSEDVGRQEELDLRRAEAEAAASAKSQFLASMSHEIRTPMNGILGVLGLILDDPLPAKQRERAQIALASAEGLLAILNDILDFSKLEAAQIRLHEEAVDLRALIGQVMDLMSPNAARKGLQLGHRVAAAVPRLVRADPVRLRQILTNLLSNATKFTDRGEIAVRVDWSGTAAAGELVIEVEDTGIGIAEDQLGSIFERFTQADTSLARRAGGTGLGLAISAQLAELMGGRIRVRSVLGMGSTFRLEIPAVATTAAPQPSGERAGRGTTPPMRVLLAEDHRTNQYVILAYLRSAGHEVAVVSNGAEAVEAAAGGDFDVVLMDVQMPVMDGLAATAAIRRLPGAAATVPVVALTASAMPGDCEACLAAGMTAYLTKPITPAMLYAALHEIHLAHGGAVADDPQRRCASGG